MMAGGGYPDEAAEKPARGKTATEVEAEQRAAWRVQCRNCGRTGAAAMGDCCDAPEWYIAR